MYCWLVTVKLQANVNSYVGQYTVSTSTDFFEVAQPLIVVTRYRITVL